ncbi:MAG: hypothetical protein IKC76_07365 [Firmicutes bacterium]|nr:hypothetical protein [Bacillota bacterium]
MKIIPAIDIREGACTRLLTDCDEFNPIYSDDPLEQAHLLKDAGATFLHVNDLDGSFVGRLRNLDTVRDMLAFNNVAIQLSGGIRKMRDIDEAFAVGVDRVLVNASTILRHPHIITEAIEKYGAARILAAIDGRNGMITYEGYETPLSHTVQSMLKEAKDLGIETIVYTDLYRYSMEERNMERIHEIIADCGMKVIVAGGLVDEDMLHQLESWGAEGAVIGKAIYSGRLDLRHLVDVFEKN